jgi:predicted NAD/FAD-binding protein
VTFEKTSTQKKIAIIGGGISGMGAAQMLGADHQVTLFEATPRLGGHARTVLAGKNGDQPVDTGFIVFNNANYPHLLRLFETLDVPVVKSNMSFGASLNGGEIEYGTTNLRAVFAQRRNLLSPKFLGMLRDIARFNANAVRLASDPNLTLDEFLIQLGTGPWFRDYYLMPMSGAIWSTPTAQMMDFPAQALVRFFENHALLSHTGKHQWYTVQGGSHEYVSRLQTALQQQGTVLRLGEPVKGVRRRDHGADVRVHGAEWEAFDAVIFATHSDDTLALLVDPTADESAILGAVSYQPNDIILHADASVMPKRRACWSSWIYSEDMTRKSDRIDLTYWMNSLQPIPHDDPHYVTLNSAREIRPDLIYDQVTLRHPVFDLAALKAQKAATVLNGQNATWFCGAWMKDGFHEDGLSSAVDVVEALNATVSPRKINPTVAVA